MDQWYIAPFCNDHVYICVLGILWQNLGDDNPWFIVPSGDDHYYGDTLTGGQWYINVVPSGMTMVTLVYRDAVTGVGEVVG